MTNWKRKLGCKCQYKHIVDWCGCSPNDFLPDDWNKIQVTQQKPFYFARKFEPVINQAIVNQLEAWLSPDKSLEGDAAYNKYWQNLYYRNDTLGAIDDAYLSLFAAISYTSLKRVAYICNQVDNSRTLNRNHIDNHNLLDANIYFEDDFFKGLLVSFDIPFSKKSNTFLEAFATPINHFIAHKQLSPTDRLIKIQVSYIYIVLNAHLINVIF